MTFYELLKSKRHELSTEEFNAFIRDEIEICRNKKLRKEFEKVMDNYEVFDNSIEELITSLAIYKKK